MPKKTSRDISRPGFFEPCEAKPDGPNNARISHPPRRMLAVGRLHWAPESSGERLEARKGWSRSDSSLVRNPAEFLELYQDPLAIACVKA